MKASVKVYAWILILLVSAVAITAQDEVDDLNVYTTVDKMPRLKGAGKSISNYIQKQIDYADTYKIRGIEGDIWVSFIVTSNGEVVQAEIEKGIDPELDTEVLAKVVATKGWKPGELNKEKVNTQMRLPIRFTLTNSERILAKQIKSLDELGKHPLFVLDNKLVDGLMEIEDYNVESIRVIKGDKAIKLYGEKAEHGVVIITSKRGTPPLY